MPRITPLRVVLFPVFCYLALVFLLFALPSSPSVNESNGDHYHQDVLRSGKRLTSVYDNIKGYRVYDASRVVEDDTFAIDWQFSKDAESNSVLLNIGTNSTINLTKLARASPAHDHDSTSKYLRIAAKGGVAKGTVLEWFEDTDSGLLGWEIESRLVLIDIQVEVTERGTIQVLPDQGVQHAESSELSGLPSDPGPFMTISNLPTTGDTSDFTSIKISDMTWRVPSKAFPIRVFLIQLTKPVAMYVFPIMLSVLDSILWTGYYTFKALSFIFIPFALILGFWSCAGRPPFKRWLRDVCTLRCLKRRKQKERAIWGPGGLIGHLEDRGGLKDDFDTEPGTRLHETNTLGTPLDFFRSKSPLDELLNTFQMTRWMTEPWGTSYADTHERYVSSGPAITINMPIERFIKSAK